jgi:sulfur-carrier protein
MKVRALYFASVRDICARPEEIWELELGAQIAGFAKVLVERYPALRARAESLRFARNEAFAALTDGLAEGDTVAVIPPVSGG